MLFLSINEQSPFRRDRSPRVDTTTSNFSVPSGGGGVGVMGRISNLTPKKSCELIVKNHSNKPCTGYNNMNYCMI